MSIENETQSSDTEVWLNVGPHSVAVITVGCDARILASVDGDLKEAAKAAGAHIKDENPADVGRLPHDWAYTGFTAVGDTSCGDKLMIKNITCDARDHPSVSRVRVADGQWPTTLAAPSTTQPPKPEPPKPMSTQGTKAMRALLAVIQSESQTLSAVFNAATDLLEEQGFITTLSLGFEELTVESTPRQDQLLVWGNRDGKGAVTRAEAFDLANSILEWLDATEPQKLAKDLGGEQ